MNRSIAIPTTLCRLMLAALAIVAAPGASAAAAANTLQAVDVQPLGTQGVQVVLTTSGAAPQPNAFAIENPARISLDLAGTALGLPQRRIDVRTNGLESVLAAEADGRTRLVLNLDRMQAYSTRVEGNRIILTLGEAGAAAGAPVVAAAAAGAAPATAAPRLNRGIQNIDFRRSPDGTGRIIVRLGDPRTPVNLRQQGNQVMVDFVGADLPQQLRRSFDVSDFATPVTGFNAIGTPNGTQLVISASGDFEQLAYQAEDQYVVEVQARRAPRAVSVERPVYTGERMTATFQDIPARTLLMLIAQTGGKNMVINDSVGGNVTLSLENVPWDHALDIVLQLKGLDKRITDNVIIVGPTAELANRDKAQLAARKELQELAPLRTELVQVNFGKAGDIASLLRSTGGEGSSLLSARGNLTVHTATNSLLIQDTSESITAIRELVQQLDIPVRQVRIEARIVAVSEDFSRDLGVRFGATGITTTGDGFISSTGNALANEDILGAGGAPFPGGAPFAPSRYNVNLPAPSPAGAISFLVLGSDYLVDLELSAAQSEGNGEVISSPQLTVTNQQEAMIAQGSEIPYQEAASSGATSVSFKDVKTSLSVTPVITPDNRLILDIAVQKERVGQLVVGIGGGQIPSIDSSEIRTRVVVNDGQTVVLGGILETERRENVKKVPLLGDVPIFGHLFKSTSRVNNKDELLIFVTPKIVREGTSTR
ncbi:MAG: type IV pilus secretin PilQ [Pseudomonadota bacterium]|nr:type IV pilus secretin PilQ [Pseudomonadota bacterium]